MTETTDTMTREDKIELGMLTAELSRSVCYMADDPEAVKSITRILMDWAHADADKRREIYRSWRNA